MKKLVLIFLLALSTLCSGCAISVPWWLFIETKPSPAPVHAEQQLARERNPDDPQPASEKSEIANAGDPDARQR